MISKKTSISSNFSTSFENKKNVRIGIAVSEWNYEITDSLQKSCVDMLLKNGIKKENIITISVPGSFELPMGLQLLIEKHKNIDSVIALGCVIQGETRHFEFICQAVAQGVKDVGLKYNKPAIFGVLTTDTYQQALDRTSGKNGNKGSEAAISAIKMVSVQHAMR